MISSGISGKATLCSLLALSVMELVAMQKPGSPLAKLQQPTQGAFAAAALHWGWQDQAAMGEEQPDGAEPESLSHRPPIREIQATAGQKTLPQYQFPAVQAVAEIQATADDRALALAETDSPGSIQTVSLPNLSAQSLAAVSPFPDVQSHWSQPFVELLATKGIITGYSDGTFRPDGDIQAAHFSVMLRRAKLYRWGTLHNGLGQDALASGGQEPSFPLASLPLDRAGEQEAAQLLQTHEIRTRAQAAVFIYRNLQGPLLSQGQGQASRVRSRLNSPS
jgi:hypothetical protein